MEGSDDKTGYIDEREPSNVDDIKAWSSENEHLFSVLRLTTTAAVRSVLLQFEPIYGRPGDGKQAWLALQSKYQNNSRQRRRTLLRRLDNRGSLILILMFFCQKYIKYAMNVVFSTKRSQLSA